MGRLWGLVMFAVASSLPLSATAAGEAGSPSGLSAPAQCPERARCRGCGCRGGPGYRGPDGRCVGFRELARVCGKPPERRCVFENAPGTGANRECALAPREKKK